MIDRLIELLNDASRICSTSKSAATRISRAEDALQRVIPQIRVTNPRAVANIGDFEAYFRSVITTAEAIELFLKGRAAKQAKSQERNYQDAYQFAIKRKASAQDFAIQNYPDPLSGQMITLQTLWDAHNTSNVATVVEADLVEEDDDAEEEFLQELLRRDHTLNGGILVGLDGYIVEIQARAVEVFNKESSWRGAVKISGMARGAITESLDRISGAFAKLQIPGPKVSILINLAPPDLPKEGTWLDLPLAIILLQASGYLPDLPEHREGDFVLMGELGLHAEVRRVPGALSLAYVAKAGQALIVPAGNEKECALILAKPGHEGCRVYPVSTLDEVIDFFQGKRKLENALKTTISFENAVEKAVDFGLIRGQLRAKRAAVISAAGGHNLLLIGPPGEGKSLMASAIPGILPRLTNEEKVQLTRIYSACGELQRDGMAVTRRPMRSIHHTASTQSVIGGGSKVPRPGEITLAHLGVLFLDEIAEFSRGTIESLRQPIESGEVQISRVGGTLNFPARFTLVAAMNPCPCGFFGSDKCKCKETDVKKYQKRISGPILDRIDLQVQLERLTTEERFAETQNDLSPKLRAEVEKARQQQVERFTGRSVPFNAAMPGGQVRELCNFSATGFDVFKTVIDTNDLSTRSMDRLAKVARTIADLEVSNQIDPRHIEEAAGFVIGGMLRENF